MTEVLVIMDGGVVQDIVADTPLPADIHIRVIDWDREDEERDDTAQFLWDNRDVLHRTGPRLSRHTSPGDAKGAYEIQERFTHGVW